MPIIFAHKCVVVLHAVWLFIHVYLHAQIIAGAGDIPVPDR